MCVDGEDERRLGVLENPPDLVLSKARAQRHGHCLEHPRREERNDERGHVRGDDDDPSASQAP